MRRLPHPASGLRPASRIAGCSALLGALLLLGCEDQRAPSEPGSPPAPLAPAPDLGAATENAFYPLQLGNEWHYDRNMVLEFFPEGGTGPSGAEEFQFEETRVLDQTEELFG